MKNIHVISTDKPSNGYILGKCIKELSDVKIGQFTKTYYLMFSQEYFQPHNIYITNDEEIKKGEYGLSSLGKVVKFTEDGIYNYSLWKKIILTTDQDLIADGIQPIDDEFLQWYIKNPSCEEVKIVDGYQIFSNKNAVKIYKIIIPKEESKQENCCTPIGQIKRYINCKWCDRKPKQETLEEIFKEAALKYAEEENSSYTNDYYGFINGAIEGVKWQQEQGKNRYSEEDMKLMFEFGYRKNNFTESTFKDALNYIKQKKK